MPTLKDPIVKYNTESGDEGDGTDYGEFHPIYQLKKIMDWENGGNFRGCDFIIFITQKQANIIVDNYMKLKSADKFEYDKAFMSYPHVLNCIISDINKHFGE